jgi:hypothetical protein
LAHAKDSQLLLLLLMLLHVGALPGSVVMKRVAVVVHHPHHFCQN